MERLRASATLRNRKKQPTASLHCLYKGLQVQIYIYILHANKRFTWGLNRSNRRCNSWNAPTHLVRPSRTITFFLFIYFFSITLRYHFLFLYFFYPPFTPTPTTHGPRHLATLLWLLQRCINSFIAFNGILKQRFKNKQKKDKALVSGMTDFAHFNDYILLANFKLQKPTAQYITH